MAPQIINALADSDLNRTPSGSGGTGVEIRQAGKNQAIAGFCHLQAVGLGNHRLAVQREPAMHFGGAYGDDDDVVSVQILLDLRVQHFAKNTGTHTVDSFQHVR